MRSNSVIVATNAIFLIQGLIKKLINADFQVFTAVNDNELKTKIKSYNPCFIFLEHCFHGNGTDEFIRDIMSINRNIHIVMWASVDIKPLFAARFIHAGAESFLSLRDNEENIERIIYHITCGNIYYPTDVEAALDRDCLFKVNGKLFTKREREIMKLCVSGNTNADIAKILSITVSTVKFHKGNIYKKIGGNKNNDILGKAIKNGIISLEDFG